jgi:hypothetical protein
VVGRELTVPSADQAFDDRGSLTDRNLVLELEGVLVELLYTADPRQVVERQPTDGLAASD